VEEQGLDVDFLVVDESRLSVEEVE